MGAPEGWVGVAARGQDPLLQLSKSKFYCMWLTLLALRNRIGILMLSLAMVVLGATSLNRLPRDLFPNIQVPVAFVGVIYKGAPPIDIEQSVVYPIEKAVSSASNVEHVESFSKQGIGAVQVWFNWGADINVGQMEVALQQAETSLTYSYIRAPFAGSISVRNLDAGAFVSGSTGSTSTFSRGILVMQDVTIVRVLVDVVEKDVPLVKIGQAADLRADAYPGRVFYGKVTRIVQALNPSTRTMTVEVDIPNPDRALKGGMFARVELLVGRHENALQIPIDAVTRLETDQYVYTVQDGKARKIPVELGIRSNGLIEITKGLSGTDPVIVSGKDLVTDGVKVAPTPMDVAKPAPQQ